MTRPAGPGRGHKVPMGNGAGKGDGWGGPKVGVGHGGEARMADPDKDRPDLPPKVASFADEPKAGPGRGHFTLAGEERRARNERHAEEMREVQYDLAHNAKREETKLAAASAYQNRLEGAPLQRAEFTGRDGEPMVIATADPIEAAKVYMRLMNEK